MATIRDVAKAAGVSISSVSRVLNSTGPISEAVRAQVLAAARELQYRPNALARSLITGRTMAVGLIVPDITNPFYGEMLHALERRLSRAGYEILLCNSGYNVRRESSFVQALLLRRVDAVVISLGHDTPDLAAELGRHNVPMVLHRYPEQLPRAYTIDLDFTPGLRQLAEHLVGLGHRTFALLTGPGGLDTADQRRDVFLAELARLGLEIETTLLLDGGFRMDGARRAVHAMLAAHRRSRPTAIVAGNDLMAFGALQAIHEAGLRVPEDFSVAGFDDVALTRVMNPPLTSVRSYSYRRGLVTARVLLDLLAEGVDRNGPGRQIVMPTRLVVRDSTGVAPARLSKVI